MFNELWATFSQQFPDNFASLLTVSTVETIYMSVLSTLIGYTAMAGTQGGGGLGSLAINYGV